MIIEGSAARFGNIAIPLNEFRELLRRFGEQTARHKVGGHSNLREQTKYLEQSGCDLISADFSEERLRNFISNVCKWGGYPGIAARVCGKNRPEKLIQQFRDAYQALSEDRIADGLITLQALHGLGGVSFSSKHLKFLDPDKTVVLDRMIEENLGYAMNRAGYLNFLADCQQIRAKLAGQPYTGWGSNGWRVSDVEMAIFQFIRSDHSSA